MRLQQEEFAVDQPDAALARPAAAVPARSLVEHLSQDLAIDRIVLIGSFERQTSSPPMAVTCFTSGTDGGKMPRATIISSINGGGSITAVSPRFWQPVLEVIEPKRRAARGIVDDERRWARSR